MSNPMLIPKVDKVVVHMGVGESGQHLVNGEGILEKITGQKIVETHAKRTLPGFGIKKKNLLAVRLHLGESEQKISSAHLLKL